MAIRFSTSRFSHNRNRQPVTPASLYTIFGCFAVFGLVFAGVGVSSWFKAESSRRWLVVQGRVSSSIVDRHTGKKGTTYSAQVVYSYTHRDKPYTGNRLAMMNSASSNYSVAQRTVDRYAPGTAVKVYVDPADPYASVLTPGAGWGEIIFIIFGFVFGLIGSWGLMNTPRLAEESQANFAQQQGIDVLSQIK